jgi:hypothetical protein
MRAKCSRMCPQPHGRAFPLASALDLVLRRCSRPPPGRYRDRHAPNQPHSGGDWFRSCHPYSTCQRTTIDLNDLAITANSEPNDKTDLEYNSREGFSRYNAQFVDLPPVEQLKTAKDCEVFARTGGFGSIESRDMEVEKTVFCVVTHGGKVARLRLTDIIPRQLDAPDLKFILTTWKHTGG